MHDSKSKWIIRYQQIVEAELNDDGGFRIINKTEWTEPKELRGIKGYFIKIIIILEAAFFRPGFSSYTLPYFIFMFAAAMPVIDCLKSKF
jgi:hypothetical protein